jgi:hypothetical protein
MPEFSLETYVRVAIKSATEALKKWRYEPGPETTTIVEFRFYRKSPTAEEQP